MNQLIVNKFLNNFAEHYFSIGLSEKLVQRLVNGLLSYLELLWKYLV